MKRLLTMLGILGLPAAALASDFKVEVPAFADGILKPAQYAAAMGCTGGNVSLVGRAGGHQELCRDAL